MNIKQILAFTVIYLGCIVAISLAESSDGAQSANKAQGEVDPEKMEYAKGSVCGYCQYCQFCTLCDKDCPCEASATQPNCHLCKYCKFCYLCSAVCDTICQPGGILDKVSASIVNALPSFNKDEVDGDISGVRDWIDKERDEL